MLTYAAPSPASARTTGRTRRALFVGVDRLRAGPGRLTAHVEYRGTGPSQRSSVGDRRVGSRKLPPSEKESGVTFTTPMTAGRGNDRDDETGGHGRRLANHVEGDRAFSGSADTQSQQGHCLGARRGG